MEAAEAGTAAKHRLLVRSGVAVVSRVAQFAGIAQRATNRRIAMSDASDKYREVNHVRANRPTTLQRVEIARRHAYLGDVVAGTALVAGSKRVQIYRKPRCPRNYSTLLYFTGISVSFAGTARADAWSRPR